MHNKKVLITGSCWFEMTGLWLALSEDGYDVYRAPFEYSCAPHAYDLTVVALSAEKILGWGRYIPAIRALRKRVSGNIIVLVPDRLKNLTVLQDVCLIYNGHESIDNIKKFLYSQLKADKTIQKKNFYMTSGQLSVLKKISNRSNSSRVYDRRMYYHQSCLVKNTGVKNLNILRIAGLDKEIYSLDTACTTII
ncbi:TPA: hypothetical protein MYR45_004879 [Escherichia coli]|uniref:hypothetical protein n=1 Tax=Escherichia coli TaxID=562 RepID=UPI0038908179|nr:hypothetical protein [Escherichia coli]HCB2839988.1 hypothetical protein [Escherichia coli]